MFGLVEPYSGHFFDAEWIEYDVNNKVYKPAVKIKIKGQSEIGVSTGVKESVQLQDMQGRMVTKETFSINVVENHKYKIRDKIHFIEGDLMYTVYKVSDNILHPNSIANLMFPKSNNRPKVLHLGD